MAYNYTGIMRVNRIGRCITASRFCRLSQLSWPSKTSESLMSDMNRDQNLTAQGPTGSRNRGTGHVQDLVAQSRHQTLPGLASCASNAAAAWSVTGMGKSGHIGGKIAATLASTGTPAFFVHPGEASHGDLGMITPKGSGHCGFLFWRDRRNHHHIAATEKTRTTPDHDDRRARTPLSAKPHQLF